MQDIFPHHAYCLVGDRESCRTQLYTTLDTHKFIYVGNPDFTELVFENLGVDDARVIIHRQSSRAVQGAHKVFVVYAYTFTTEAQNALLKVIEEPAPSTQFVFVVPSLDRLLPTVKSRLHVEEVFGGGNTDEAKQFIQASVGERLKIAEKLAKDIKDEKDSREHAYILLGGIEEVLAKDSVRYKNALGSILEIKRSLTLRGVSVKQLLEQLALVL